MPVFFNLLLIAPAILTAIGDILIGLAVYKVHEKLQEERRIDMEVVREVNHEKRLVIVGVTLILFGLVLDSIYKVNKGYF